MAEARIIQPSYARGEIGPHLYGRVDTAPYAVALRTAYNVIIHSYGGASNRAGLKFVGPCSTHTGTPPQLIEFKYNTVDTYILEFGDMYMRVVRNDAHVLNGAKNITGVTQADPAVVTSVAHGFSDGDDVYVAGVSGMAELNNRWFTVANKTNDTFELMSQQTGADVNSTTYTAYSSGGTVSSVYELPTSYAVDDLATMKFVQSANVMTLTHPSYPPMELSRADHDDWTIEEITFQPDQDDPVDVALTVNNTPNGKTYKYKVTAINDETEEESLPGLRITAVTVQSATAANPVVVTANSHGYDDGDEVEINGFSEMTEVNGRRFTVANSDTNTFELEDEDGSSYSAEVTGGTANATHVETTNGGDTPDNTIVFTPADSATKHSVYKYDNGTYGWIGDTEDGAFNDTNIDPDLALTPPRARNPFFGEGNYPAAVSYYEQRRVFGGSNNSPDTNHYSVTAAQSNMSQASPRRADDAIAATLTSLEVNAIRHYVPGNDLLILTSGSEWRVNAGSEAAFSAETLRQKPQSQWGCSHIRPLVVGDVTLYVTENASMVRSLGYELSIDGYRGNNITIFAPHLMEQYKMVDWALAKYPEPRIAGVLEDGSGVHLTFNPEQEVIAWTRWGTSGKFKRVASTRPSSDDRDIAHYFVVERTVGGSPARYIERVSSRRFDDVKDCFFVDCGLTLDSPVSITDATQASPVVVTAASHGFSDGDEVDLHNIEWEPYYDEYYNETQPDQLNGRRYFVAGADTNTFKLIEVEGRVDITHATQASPVVVTAASHGFSDGDVIGVFNVAGMTELNGGVYKVANSSSDDFELTDLSDVDVDGTGFTAYSLGGQMYPAEDGSSFSAYVEGGAARKAVSSVSGLWHIEGREVVALADGDVVEELTVSNGSVSFDRAYSRVHVGLRFIADIGTLDPEVPGGGTMQGKSKRVPFATIRVKDTRGLFIGQDSTEMAELKQRQFENMGEPTRLLTGDVEIDMFSDWDGGGRIYIRQLYPLPLTITASIPMLEVGDDDE